MHASIACLFIYIWFVYQLTSDISLWFKKKWYDTKHNTFFQKNLPPPYNENVDVIIIFIGGDLTFWTYWSHTNVPQVAINVLC